MRRNLLFCLLACVGLSGCDSEIKDAVREELKDPYSVKFEKIVRLQSRACVLYNAKNSYGAYSGIVTAQLIDLGTASSGGTNWYVEARDASSCDTYTLEDKLRADLEDKASEAEVLSVLKDRKLVPLTASSTDDIAYGRGPCSKLVSDLLTASRLAHSTDDTKAKAHWEADYQKNLGELRAGSCNSDQEESGAIEPYTDQEVEAAQAAADALAAEDELKQ